MNWKIRQWEEGIWKEVQLENKLNEKLMAKGAAAAKEEKNNNNNNKINYVSDYTFKLSLDSQMKIHFDTHGRKKPRIFIYIFLYHRVPANGVISLCHEL